MFNVAIMYSVIVIVNGSLTDSKNHADTFSITDNEASWYGMYNPITYLLSEPSVRYSEGGFDKKKQKKKKVYGPAYFINEPPTFSRKSYPLLWFRNYYLQKIYIVTYMYRYGMSTFLGTTQEK